MPWAFGPMLTAVAMGAAAVVVANPVVVPRADVQIPAADLAIAVTADGRGDAVDMLDEDFIRAVGPAPAASTNPLAILTELVGVLVADAAYLGKNAILHAFATGTRVIADPALTSTSYPYYPSYPYLPAVPSDPAPLPWPVPTAPSTDAGELGPVVAQALTAILTDVDQISDVRAIAAAFVAGAALATEHLPVGGPVLESVQRDLGQALRDTASVVAALPRPREVIGDGIRTAVTAVTHLPLMPVGAVPVPHFDTRPEQDLDTAPTAEPAPSFADDPSTTEDPGAAPPLADRRTRAVEDLGLGPVKQLAESAVSVADQIAGFRPAGVADALGLGQQDRRESVDAADTRAERAGRTAR